MKTLGNSKFKVEYDTIKAGIRSITFKDDPYKLNWVEGEQIFGKLYGSNDVIQDIKVSPNKIEAKLYYKELDVLSTVEVDEHFVYYDYVFTNKQRKTLEFEPGEIGIYAPINDSYLSANHSEEKRCHAHIWCGDSSSYIYALRMNGEENNFAMQLVNGQIYHYGVLRKMKSFDRGDFVLFFRKFSINPNDRIHIRFKIFSFRTPKRFYEKAALEENFLNIITKKYTYTLNEEVNVKLIGKNIEKINVECNDIPISVNCIEKDTYELKGNFKTIGKKVFKVKYNNHTTHFDFNVIEDKFNLIDNRLKFLIENQQCLDKSSKNFGAFYLYDFENETKFYDKKMFSSTNLGGKRVGMTCAILARLLNDKNLNPEFKEKLEDSLFKSVNFINNYIVMDNGIVSETAVNKHLNICDDVHKYSLYCLLYVKLYEYTSNDVYFKKACSIIKKFYDRGGMHGYPINLPISELLKIAQEHEFAEQYNMLSNYFSKHADYVLKMGIHFSKFNFHFDHNLVASSIDILLESYLAFEDERYLMQAQKELKLLEAFNGNQPSVHLNDIAIRHSDAYAKGKSKLYGDTFPQQGSCLTAMVFYKYAKIVGDKAYSLRANNILENNFLLFNNNQASCAFIYPLIVNQKKANLFDPWANDQDWILYYNLMFNTNMKQDKIK